MQNLVTPQEAVKLYRHSSAEIFAPAERVARIFQAQMTLAPGQDTYTESQALALLACVWNAGRIQGIRSERLRKRERAAADLAKACPRTGTLYAKGMGVMPVYSIGGGFLDTPEGWKLWCECRKQAEEVMRPYHEAKAAWEAERTTLT